MTKMNWKMLLGIALLSMTTLTFTACGDDDDDDDQPANTNGAGDGTFQGAKRVFGENLPKAYGRLENGKDYKRFTMTYDANGFVTKVHGERYGSDGYQKDWLLSYSGSTCTIAYYKKGEFKYNVVVTIGSNGYMAEAKQPDGETLRCTYDGDYLTSITVSEPGDEDEKVTFAWQGGNIVQAGWIDSTPTSISYSSIPNVGCVMQYDDGLNIDMDDWEMYYYLGMIGKGTAYLPQAHTKQKSSTNYTAGTNQWTLDGKGRAVNLVMTKKRVENGYESTETREYYWEW